MPPICASPAMPAASTPHCHSHQLLARPSAAPAPDDIVSPSARATFNEASHARSLRQSIWPEAGSPGRPTVDTRDLARRLWESCTTFESSPVYAAAGMLRLRWLQHISLSGHVRSGLLVDGMLVGATYGACVGVQAGPTLVHFLFFLVGRAAICAAALIASIEAALRCLDHALAEGAEAAAHEWARAEAAAAAVSGAAMVALGGAHALTRLALQGVDRAKRATHGAWQSACAQGRQLLVHPRFGHLAQRALSATRHSRTMGARAMEGVAATLRAASCVVSIPLGLTAALVGAMAGGMGRGAVLAGSFAATPFYDALANGGLAHELERRQLLYAKALAYGAAFPVLSERLKAAALTEDQSVPNELRSDLRLRAQGLRAEIGEAVDAWTSSYKRMLAESYGVFACGCVKGTSGAACRAGCCAQGVSPFRAAERWDHLYQGQDEQPAAWADIDSDFAPSATNVAGKRVQAVQTAATYPWLRWLHTLPLSAREVSRELRIELDDLRLLDGARSALTNVANLPVEPVSSAPPRSGADSGHAPPGAVAGPVREQCPLPRSAVSRTLENAQLDSGRLAHRRRPEEALI